jgi:membrane-associated phospholipid phosphatase
MRQIVELSNSVSDSIDDLKFSTDKDFEYWKKNPYRLPEGLNIDWKNILPDPPPNRSEQTKAELQYVYLVSKTRTKHETKLVHDVDKDPGLIFVPLLQDNNLPYPKEEIEAYWSVIYPVVMNLKWLHNRPRPYQLGLKYGMDIQYIKTDTHHTPAYPSGHTSYGHLISLVLSDKYPTYAPKFQVLSDQTGQARVWQGVHYPSDNDAAVKLTNNIWKDIQYKTYRS